MKYNNWCPIFGQFTGAHFPDLKPNSHDIHNIMKFHLNSLHAQIYYKWPGSLVSKTG